MVNDESESMVNKSRGFKNAFVTRHSHLDEIFGDFGFCLAVVVVDVVGAIATVLHNLA